MSSATPASDKFAAVPVVGSLDLIQETDGANVDYDTDEEDVEDEDYTSATLYYGVRGNAARASGSYLNTVAYTAVAKYAAGDSVTFDPESYTFNSSTTWTDALIIQTTLYTEAEDLGTASVTFSGGPDNVVTTCANPTLSVVNSMLRVTCTLPEAAAGTYDVAVVLDKFGQIYVDTYTYEEQKTLADLTYMQEMTSDICEAPFLDVTGTES